MILKQVIRYTNANAIEATWVDQVTVPAVGVEGEEGYQPETVTEVERLCKAYADTQMADFRADVAQYGGDVAEYEALIAEVEAAYVPPPPPSPPPVPQAVTMRQARLALLGAGLLPMAEAAIAALPSPQKEAAEIEWEYAQEVQRNHGLVPAMAQALGMTEAQIDELFIAAAVL